MDNLIKQLRALLADGKLGGSANFAADLIRAYDKYGHLTAGQSPWVGKLIERATQAAPETKALDANIQAIFAMFTRAHDAGLKRPKIRLETDQGQYLVLARAGDRSKYEGQVQITDGGPFGDSRYFGRIDAAGNLSSGRDMNQDVQSLVEKLAHDPAGTAAIYGKRTGDCCFCGRHLEDGRSVAMGYGPVCAEKFGVAWGQEKALVKAKVSLVAETLEPQVEYLDRKAA